MSKIFYRSYDVIDFYMKKYGVENFQYEFYKGLGDLIKNPNLQPDSLKVNRDYFIRELMENRQPGALVGDLVSIVMNDIVTKDAFITADLSLDIYKGGPLLYLSEINVGKSKFESESSISLSEEDDKVTIQKSFGDNGDRITYIQEDKGGNNLVFFGIGNSVASVSEFKSNPAINRKEVFEL